MHKLLYKGFGFFGCLGFFFWFVLNIVFIWIERQSNFDDLLQNYSGFKYLVFGPYAETCILFPINLWLRWFWLNTSVYFHLDIRMLGEIQGPANCKIWTLDQAVT